MNHLLFIDTPLVVVVALIFLLLFSGKKIPELMKGMGKGVRIIKEGLNGVESEIKNVTKETKKVDPNEEKEYRANYEDTESEFKPNESNSDEIVEETNEPRNTNDKFMPNQTSDVIKEQTIENQDSKTKFVPKKKPIRKSQS